MSTDAATGVAAAAAHRARSAWAKDRSQPDGMFSGGRNCHPAKGVLASNPCAVRFAAATVSSEQTHAKARKPSPQIASVETGGVLPRAVGRRAQNLTRRLSSHWYLD